MFVRYTERLGGGPAERYSLAKMLPYETESSACARAASVVEGSLRRLSRLNVEVDLNWRRPRAILRTAIPFSKSKCSPPSWQADMYLCDR